MRLWGCETILHMLGLAFYEWQLSRINPLYPDLWKLVQRRNELHRGLNQLLGRPVDAPLKLFGSW